MMLSSKIVFGGAIAASVLILSGCSEKPVKCFGVSGHSPDHGIIMGAGECKKLAGGQAKPLTTAETKQYKPYPYDSYVKCYGVAAAGMNDCGTKSTACGGSVHTARTPGAWIAIPKGVCEQLKGARIGKVKS
jgi:uncharacterized membrane protein